MKRLLLIMLMSVVGIFVSIAQTVRTGAPSNKKDAHVKPIMHQSLAKKQVKKAKTQIAPFSPRILNQDVKIVSTVSHGDKKIQVVQNANGTFSKRIAVNNATQKLNRKATTSFKRSTADNTLFESFEGWDGVDPNWTPAGWLRDNKTSITTWEMSSEGFVTPTDGDYMAWVNLGFIYDEDENLTITDPRDEMLISPAFTPAINDKLYFDVNFAATWMFYDYFADEVDFDNPIFNFQVLVSIDDGNNWNVICDIAEEGKNYYTEDNIWDYMDNEWYSKGISLESYVGKSIKIAFHYTDRDGGDNVGLDNIAVREPNPTALYMRPQGYFKVGLSNDWYYLPDVMLGHAYDNSIWRNLSTDAETYSWEFENPDGSGTKLTSTDKNPNILYPYNTFDIPTLTATGSGNSSTYQWGTGEGLMLMQTGGNMVMSDSTVYGCGNYDLSYDFYYYTSSKGYYFGTTDDNSIDGVANYFEKPVHKYILEGVTAAVYPFDFPANTEFTMVIHRVTDGVVSDEDIIATSTCTTADVVDDMMSFAGFITIDPETGLEIENDYIEIEDAILIEIKGFNNIPGGEIAFINQEFDVDPTGENNAYYYTPDRQLYYYNGSTSLLFSLNVTYSYLLANSDEFIAPTSGGEKTFDVISYYSPDGWWLEEDLPEWLSDDLVFDNTTWEIQYTLKAEPLPADVPSRQAVVKIATYGADMSILVQQGSTGIPTIKIENTKVVNKGNGFELTYTPDYSGVSVYNVAGQKLAGYQLPATGTFTVPAGNYSKGVYLFSFTGAKGVSTVKVLK